MQRLIVKSPTGAFNRVVSLFLFSPKDDETDETGQAEGSGGSGTIAYDTLVQTIDPPYLFHHI